MPRKRTRLAELPTHLPTIMLPGWRAKLGKRLPPVGARKPITREEWDAARGEGSMRLRKEMFGQINRQTIFDRYYPKQAKVALRRFGGNTFKAAVFLEFNSTEAGRSALEECKGDINRASALMQIRENRLTRGGIAASVREAALKKYPDPLKAADYLRLQYALNSRRIGIRSAFSSYPGNMREEEGRRYVEARQKIADQIIGDLDARIAKYKDPRRALLVFNELSRGLVENFEESKSQMDKIEKDIRGISSARLADRQLRRDLSHTADFYSDNAAMRRYGPYAGPIVESHTTEFREFERGERSVPSRLTGRALLRQLRKKRSRKAS